MSDEEIIIEVAKLGGQCLHENVEVGVIEDGTGSYTEIECKDCHCDPSAKEVPKYLTSRDAIIPVIERQDWETLGLICDLAVQQVNSEKHGYGVRNIFKSTPRQLCIALLKSTGKWVEVAATPSRK